MTHKQLPLEDLPEYLKSHREAGPTKNAPVVGMGQIIVPKKKSFGWLRIALAATMLSLFLGIGYFSYNMATAPSQLTVIVDMNDSPNPQQSISRIVSEGGDEIIAVKQKKDSIYEVKVSTRKSKKSFLDWLLGRKEVKDASLED